MGMSYNMSFENALIKPENYRYAEARAALAAFEVYMDNFTADEFAPEVHRLAEALRALIEEHITHARRVLERLVDTQ